VYRVTIAGDKDPRSALAKDARQSIKPVKDYTVELTVTAVRTPPAEGDAEPGKEFLRSNHFIDSENRRVKALAERAVGDEKEPWAKACNIERWVHDHMHVDATVPVTPAGQIAEKLRGDCRQYAMLAAAMCRAAGVPSRTALGVVYGEDRSGKPILGFHMWVEVYVRGQWLGIDGTLGDGGVGAAHIKISDHSWHNTQSLTPLLPLQRVLGKMKVEVVRVGYR
jgi:transglutaminase-like putative cysteine protease